MKKILLLAGALLVSCFALTSCSGGGGGSDDLNVNALAGRRFTFNSPNNMLGAMYVDVYDRIGSSDALDARFYFGSRGGASSAGSVKVLSTKKSENKSSKKNWDKVEFTFQIHDSEVSEEVNFKAFFAWFVSSDSTTGAEQEAEEGEDAAADAGGMASDSYITGMEPMKVTLTYENNSGGQYRMDPTTVYLDDEEEMVQTVLIQADFTVE